jgi:hypothetical protein
MRSNHKKSSNLHVEEVDIIFLDIDGVLLPFGDSSTLQREAHADGCIFPNRTMDALTTLLQLMENLELSVHSKKTKKETIMLRGNPKIVLSSTWRAQPTFIKDILSSFQSYVNVNPKAAAIWKTHSNSFFDITDPLVHSTRHEEIYNWIKLHNDNGDGTLDQRKQGKSQTMHAPAKEFVLRSWIALDDEELVDVPHAYPGTEKHAVKTVSSVGLVHSDVELALKLLKDQIMEKGDKFTNVI